MCFTAWMALPAEDHLSEFVAKALDLLRIGCGSEMLCKFKERVLREVCPSSGRQSPCSSRLERQHFTLNIVEDPWEIP